MSFVDLNDSVIAQVRSAADIVDFVSQVTPLKLAGKSYKGLCPFHREKSPSFHVDRVKGLFYCFGCGTGGDVFKFLALTERFTFPEAVEHVAARVGIELPRRKRTQRESDKDDLLELMDDASEAFSQALGWGDNAARRRGQEVRLRLRARLLGLHPHPALPQAWGEEARGGRAGHAAQDRQRLLRPFPQPAHHSHPQRDGGAGRLRRTLARRQRPEIPQFPGVGAL